MSVARLEAALARHPRLAIAVSGGVDSMTLAHIAHGVTEVAMIHAASPAVPAEATRRVRDHAAREGWRLAVLDAGELADPRYRENPVDRCFFCKTNLYRRIREVWRDAIASGANVDDLGDFRPGLDAARHHGVVHPFVEAGVGKAAIYALAAGHGLDDLAALPPQPCLASRIETGIGVDAATLGFIETAERALRPLARGVRDLRCRVTRAGVHIELAPLPPAGDRARLDAAAADFVRRSGRRYAGLRAYRRGSAFLR